MAAGLGYKEFTTGDVLTAADANGYLASQVVMVFASAAARTSAIASPQEGMISYLKDTNSTEYYSGSAWVAIGGSTGATWTTFTPTYTDITVGNGTVTSRYTKSGNLVTVYFRFVLGSTSSTGVNPVVTLPSPIVPLYRFAMTGIWFDSGVQAYVGSFGTDGANVNCEGISTGGTWATTGNGRPFTLGANDWLQFTGTYEVA
jgi:hypothetical protein